jgi:hypothetical protein
MKNIKHRAVKAAALLTAMLLTASMSVSCGKLAPAESTRMPDAATDNIIAAPTDVPETEAPAATTVPTQEPTPLVTAVPTQEPTPAATDAPTEEPTPLPTDVPTEAPTATPSPTPTPEPTVTPTATPAPTKTSTATPAPTKIPTATPAPTKTSTATPAPTKTPEPTAAKVLFTVANVFSDNMVVQRGEPVKIWGFAERGAEGGTIHGEFMGETAETTIQNGEWMLVFGSFDACADMGNNIRIYSDDKSVTLKDVLIGDVYFVAGQSNCAYSMNEHWAFVDPADTVRCSRNADYDLPIRLNYNTQNAPNTSVTRGTDQVARDLTRTNTWKIATRSNVITFSAIGYLFARNYVLMTGGTVPVGLIEIDGNGRPLGAFLCNEVATAYRTDSYHTMKGYYVTTGVNADHARFLYNEYMAPFARMPIAGMVWYQGESDLNYNESRRYAEVFTAFVEYMRGTHNTNNRNFPVYFIEFPSIYTQPSGFSGTWAYMDVGQIRGRMGNMVTMSDNMFQVQSGDMWSDKTYWNSLHPNCKYEQALRAAKIACAFKGEGGVTMDNASGPILESVTVAADGRTATVKYKNVGDGLRTVDGSDTVRGFSALSTSNVSIDLTGRITGPDTVEVVLPSSSNGLGYNVRTSYYFGDQLNLCNSSGIPAGAFWYAR